MLRPVINYGDACAYLLQRERGAVTALLTAGERLVVVDLRRVRVSRICAAQQYQS